MSLTSNMIRILNHDFDVLAILGEVTDAEISEEINREYTLRFTAVIDKEKSQYITYQNLAESEGNYFNIVYTREKRNADDTLTVDVECEHVSYDLADENNVLSSYTDYGTPTEILAELLSGTGFTFGSVNFSSPVTVSINESVTRRGVLISLAQQLGGELKFDKYAVSLLTRRGADRGLQFRYRKNILGMSRITDNRNKIDGLPTVTYETEVAELEYADGFDSSEHYELGDTVQVIDPDLNINLPMRIIKDSHNPVLHMRGLVSISNATSAFVKDIYDTIYTVSQNSVNKGSAYNGCSITPENGFVAQRGDNAVRSTLNATDGIKIEMSSNGGASWYPAFYITVSGGVPKLYLAGNAEFQGNLNTALDSNVGNRLNIGNQSSLSGKGIYFYDSSGNQCFISFDSFGDLLFSNAGKITMLAGEAVAITGESVSINATEDTIVSGADTLTISAGNGIMISVQPGGYISFNTVPKATGKFVALAGNNTQSDSHSHTVVIGGTTYTTSTNTHAHAQT